MIKPSVPAKAKRNSNAIVPLVCSGAFSDNGLRRAKSLLQSSYDIVVADSSFVDDALRDTNSADPFDYLALSPQLLGKSLADALSCLDVAALWAVRGGFGSIVSLFNMSENFDRVPLIVGFSDITAIHLWLYSQRLGCSIHGANLNGLHHLPSKTIDATVDLIKGFGVGKPLQLGDSLVCLRGGKAEGVVIGGNLSIIASMVGTKFLPSFNNAILLIEDIAEHPYRIHRLFAQLYGAGVLDNIAGVVVGEFSPPDGVDFFRLQEFVWNLVLDYIPDDVPVLVGANVGHGKDNYPVPMGVLGVLNADEKTLTPVGNWVEFCL